MPHNINNSTAVQAADPYFLTVLVSSSSIGLRKRFYKKEDGSVGKEEYGSAKHFGVFPHVVKNIYELSNLLSDLETVSNNGIIRGALKEGVEPKETLRQNKNFLDVPRYYLCVDIDSVPCPAFLDPASEAPEMIMDHLIGLLPPEFHDASYHYQYSSSFGTEILTGSGTYGQTLKAHLWFMLDQPHTCKELKRWAQFVNATAGYNLIDVSLYNPVQMHYVAKPRFDDLPDPVKQRSGLIERESDVVALVIPDKELPSRDSAKGERGHVIGTAPGFENKLKQIGEPIGFHNPIYRAMCSYFWTCWHRGIEHDPKELKERLRARIQDADKGSRDQSQIDRYMSDEYLDNQIKSVYEQFIEDLEDQSKRSTQVEPTYPDEAVSLAQGRKSTNDFVSDFMWGTVPAWKSRQEDYQKRRKSWEDQKEAANVKGEIFAVPEPKKPAYPKDCLAPDVGTGKTHAAIYHIARDIHRKRYLSGENVRPVVIFVPTIELAEELKQTAIQHGIHRVEIMRGRLRDNPAKPDGKMCADPGRIRAVEGYAGNARNDACGSGIDGKSCEFYKTCAYQQQRQSLKNADLIIMSHANYFLPPLNTSLNPEFVIIDEDITKSALPGENIKNPSQDERDIPFDFLTKERKVQESKGGKKATKILMDYSKRLSQALANCPDSTLTREALKKCGLSKKNCQQAAQIERDRIENPKDIVPTLKTKTFIKLAKKVENLRPYYVLADMWEKLAIFLENDEDTICATVRKTLNHKKKEVIRILKKKEVNKAYQRPTLILDATFSPEAFNAIFNDLDRYLNLEVQKPYQYVRQVINQDVAVSSFETKKEGKVTPEPIAYGVYAHIQKMARLYAGKGSGKYDVLVVMPLKIEKLLTNEEFFQPFPDNVAIDHFNNIRGKNAYEGVASLISISRLLPPVSAIEELAESAKQKAIDRIIPNDYGQLFFPTETRALRLADGTGFPVHNQRYHMDPVANASLNGVMLAELIQAIGRGRGTNRGENDPLHVDIITDKVLPITVHETVSLNELLYDRLDYLVMNGAMPSNPGDQAKAYPGIFKTGKAAKRYKENLLENSPHSTIDNYIIAKWGQLIQHGVNAPLTHRVEYRSKPGSRGPAKTFLYNSQIIPQPLEWIKAHISPDAVLTADPEPLPWAFPALPWKDDFSEPALIDNKAAHLLPLPDLDKIERKVKEKKGDQIYTIEDIGHWFEKTYAEMDQLLKFFKDDEKAVFSYLLSKAICDAPPAYRSAVYKKLPPAVQDMLDKGLLEKLPLVQDLPTCRIITDYRQ